MSVDMEGVRDRVNERRLETGKCFWVYGRCDRGRGRQPLAVFAGGLLEYINESGKENLRDMCETIRNKADECAGEALRVDDTAMTEACPNKIGSEERMEAAVTPTCTEAVLQFVEQRNEEEEVSMKTDNRMQVVTDEIMANIVGYSKATKFEVIYARQENTIALTFKDNGVPYDPLKAKTPDVTAKIEDRKEGGLGIFMVKKMSSGVDYRYEDGMNCLTITFVD